MISKTKQLTIELQKRRLTNKNIVLYHLQIFHIHSHVTSQQPCEVGSTDSTFSFNRWENESQSS